MVAVSADAIAVVVAVVVADECVVAVGRGAVRIGVTGTTGDGAGAGVLDACTVGNDVLPVVVAIATGVVLPSTDGERSADRVLRLVVVAVVVLVADSPVLAVVVAVPGIKTVELVLVVLAVADWFFTGVLVADAVLVVVVAIVTTDELATAKEDAAVPNDDVVA